MKVLVTGTAGRVGRGIYVALMKEHQVTGLDRQPCSTADFVGDLRDLDLLQSAMNDVEVVIHTAGLHAPHVGIYPDEEFNSINVEGTQTVARLAHENGVKHLVFTSTTALYGQASKLEGRTAWVNESTKPEPRTIYHRSKIDAEKFLEDFSQTHGLPVTVLQMSRCFPEPANQMAIYRLNRGIDARDVASAHLKALDKRLPGFWRFIVSAATPFSPNDCEQLYDDAAKLICEHVPDLAAEFKKRGWSLPATLDRVYDSSSAQKELGWTPQYGFESVLEMLDQGMSEVLPPGSGDDDD